MAESHLAPHIMLHVLVCLCVHASGLHQPRGIASRRHRRFPRITRCTHKPPLACFSLHTLLSVANRLSSKRSGSGDLGRLSEPWALLPSVASAARTVTVIRTLNTATFRLPGHCYSLRWLGARCRVSPRGGLPGDAPAAATSAGTARALRHHKRPELGLWGSSPIQLVAWPWEGTRL